MPRPPPVPVAAPAPAPARGSRAAPASVAVPATVTTRGGRHVLFVAWRDLANPKAGGSEVLVDRLADGMVARGDRVTLLCGGPTAERSYQVIRNGGAYTQFLRAPLAYQRQLRDCDLVVEVCNGLPFFSPLWSWPPLALPGQSRAHRSVAAAVAAAAATVGRFTESVLMPWAHRNNLFLTVSDSTAQALQEIGVSPDRIRQICNGVVPPDPMTTRSPQPMFLALGRLSDYKRLTCCCGCGSECGWWSAASW